MFNNVHSKSTKQTLKTTVLHYMAHKPAHGKGQCAKKTPITAQSTRFMGSLVLIITDLVNQNTNKGPSLKKSAIQPLIVTVCDNINLIAL